MYGIHYNSIFADYLSVTSPPDSGLSDGIHHYLISNGYSEDSKTPEKSAYSNPDNLDMGTVLLDCNDRFHGIQFKGRALKYLRESSQLDYALGIMAIHPHSVTRLDLALDRRECFNTTVRRYKRKYPKDWCLHGLTALRMTYLLSKLPSGGTEGSVYFGKPSARHSVKAVVYNKTAQMLSEWDTKIDSDVTRYELRFFKRAGASLRDVSLPESLFYEHSSMFGMKRPSNVSKWVSGACLPEYPPMPKKTPYSRLQTYLDTNKAFTQMVDLADDMGPNGREMLLTMLEGKVRN